MRRSCECNSTFSPIDNPIGVEVLQSKENLGGVELGLTKRELFSLYV
jgi:hypothetical protein